MTEHLDVLVIGAGLSGIAAGHHLQATSPWADYAILEARDAIGGTWDLFRYPGIRSDSDMHTMGYSFRPWKGTRSLADGQDILDYITTTARDEGIDQKIRFGHRILQADWSSAEAHWRITAEQRHTETDEVTEVELTAGFIFSCTGYYRYDRGHTPEFPGAETFDGQLIHPQFWPEDLDTTGKKIVVIGSGATAVTLIPALAETAEHVTMLQRSPSYIASVPGKDHIGMAANKVLPERWAGSTVRWFRALTGQAFYEFSQKRPAAVRKLLRKGVERELPDNYDIDTHFSPHYNPWDQRLCAAPDGDIFRVIRDGKASVATDLIDTFTPTGIRLKSGVGLEADIIVSATGLELLFLGGIALSVDGEPVEINERLTYKGMMLEGVPNMAMAVGYTNASWTLKCDLTADYVARLLNGLRERGMAQATPVNTDGSVSPEPLLALSAGYVQRSLHLLPRQGAAAPWRNYQSYWRDYRAMKRGEMFDGSLVLSTPTAVREKVGS